MDRSGPEKYAASHGHEPGGPVNVGEKRKTLRWHRDTLDEWFRRAAGIAAPKVKRRASPAVKRGEGPRERFAWSTV